MSFGSTFSSDGDSSTTRATTPMTEGHSSYTHVWRSRPLPVTCETASDDSEFKPQAFDSDAVDLPCTDVGDLASQLDSMVVL